MVERSWPAILRAWTNPLLEFVSPCASLSVRSWWVKACNQCLSYQVEPCIPQTAPGTARGILLIMSRPRIVDALKGKTCDIPN
jgi:hypothetical protein